MRDAEALRQQLLHVPGVKKVNIIGEQAERIYISFSHDRLATLGLSPQDIFTTLNSQNALTAAGSIETRGAQIFIRLDGAFDKLQKIRDTPLIAQGKTLRLSDVATVERGYEGLRPCRSVTSKNPPSCSVLSCVKAGTARRWVKRWMQKRQTSMRICLWG